MLESLREVLPCILGYYPLRQDQRLVGDRYGYLVESLAKKPSSRDILGIDISELPYLCQYSTQGIGRHQEGITERPDDVSGGSSQTCSNIKARSSVLRSFRDHLG